MNISELIQKLEAIREERGEREVVKLKVLSDATGYELTEPQLVVHYLDPNDESNYAVQIV